MMRLRISSPRNFVGVKSKGVFGEDCAVTLIGLGKKWTKTSRKLEKSLTELKKLQISGGLGSRGLGSDHGHTQGSGDSTQVTLVQPRPEDDRVKVKTPKE